MQHRLESILAWFAKRILRKYRPDVIAVTGSVGKTSAKEAIFTVLNGSYAVRKSQGNLNNELGLPLSIINAPSGGRSVIGWLRVFLQAWKLITRSRPYSEMLILEMGADHPGDLKKLTDIARPRVSVTTAVAPVHTEFFKDLDALANEKSTLAQETESDGYVILNADDPVVLGFRDQTKAHVLTYGLASNADVRAADVSIALGRPDPRAHVPNILGMDFQIHFDGRTADVFLNQAVGIPAVSAALAGAAVGLAYGLELKDAAQSFAHYRAPNGRLRILDGLHNAVLIDDSYNASPRAAVAALEFLTSLKVDLTELVQAGSKAKPNRIRRIAVFGDMAELGPLSESGHREVGIAAAKLADLLVTVGPLARIIGRAAIHAGMKLTQVAQFDDQASAVHLLKQEIGPDDLVLVKGSQSARMEKIVEQILLDPNQAGKLLVRQGPEWQQ